MYFYTALFSVLLFDLDEVISVLTDPYTTHDNVTSRNYYDVPIVVFMKPENYVVEILDQDAKHSPTNNFVKSVASDPPKKDSVTEKGIPFEFRVRIDREKVAMGGYINIYFHAYTKTQPETKSKIIAAVQRLEAKKYDEAYFELTHQVIWSQTPLPRIFTIDMSAKGKKLEYIEPKLESKVEVKEEPKNKTRHPTDNAHLLTLTFADADDSQMLPTELDGKDAKAKEKVIKLVPIRLQ
ncbi:hypothetical protein Ddc_13078 [Ditylenchus destructor]|nr:hypothetical protein Ddc_13078 [Ditylenchus destructor]